MPEGTFGVGLTGCGWDVMGAAGRIGGNVDRGGGGGGIGGVAGAAFTGSFGSDSEAAGDPAGGGGVTEGGEDGVDD
ncbi:hypothetical protein CA13_21060 [Planctomycetes bacterium CA13]|uniref:Uncharacterized protein n=1 Tax=Novipirellula herctigrandis TaxID=2527986 RepID=A0A5C5Z0G9_9BACT|nr:hypothetical protein CA13_21060 [Planctomycetes bacterium CA13]